MSGGVLEWLAYSDWKFDDAIQQIEQYIDDYPMMKQETKDELRRGINAFKTTKIYAKHIDYLMAGDHGEESFVKRIQEDLSNECFYE